MVNVREIAGTDPNYELQQRIGSGAFGVVYKARRRSDNKIVAKKIMQVREENLQAIKVEARALDYLQGRRNIVQWSPDIAIDILKGSIHLHMKYYPMGDLANAIAKRRLSSTRYTQLEVLELFQDMVNALTDCHRKGIIHRDIKPANILLDTVPVVGAGPGNGTRVAGFLTDFGVGKLTLAAILHYDAVASTMAGTEPYMPPEAFQGIVGTETDIFSLGCVMFEVCELRRAYHSRLRTTSPVVTGPYHEHTKKAISACMKLNRTERPSIAKLAGYLQQLIAAVKTPAPQAPPSTAPPPYTPRQPPPALFPPAQPHKQPVLIAAMPAAQPAQTMPAPRVVYNNQRSNETAAAACGVCAAATCCCCMCTVM